MSLLNWVMKGVEQENDKSNEKIDEGIQQDKFNNDIQKRKEALRKLTQGQNPLEKNDVENNVSHSKEQKKSVEVYSVKTNDDLTVILNFIKNGEPIIINIKKVSKEENQKLQDFLSGMIFALDAHISLLLDDMYLITPKNVKID